MAQICPACQTSNDDNATTCRNCGAALPGARSSDAASSTEKFVPASTSPPAGASPKPASAAARRAASSGAIAEAARRAAAQQRAAQQAAQQKATPATPGSTGAPRPAAGSRLPLGVPRRGITAPINSALDRAGLPRFTTQRYLAIWAGFVVVILLVILALVWIGASNARQNATNTLTPTPQPGAVLTATTVTMTTTKGTFKIQLYADDPTVKGIVQNFRAKVASGYYDGKIFHRVEDWIVQGGAPDCNMDTTKGCAAGGGVINAGPYNDKDFKAGSIGMASTSSHSLSVNASQWFITKKDAPSLKNNYPNFGQVTEGMDVVNQLVGCKPKAGGSATDLDCTGADKIITATLGLQ